MPGAISPGELRYLQWGKKPARDKNVPAHSPHRETGLWQGRVYFGNKGLTPAAFKVLQTWAQEKRESMPLLTQALYPLNGERAGIEQMTEIAGAVSQDPRLKEFPLTRKTEEALLAPLLLYEQFLGDASNGVRFQTLFMTDRIENPQAQDYLIHRLYGHPDYTLRNYLFYLEALKKEDKRPERSADLLEMVHDFHPWVRQQLAKMLPSFPDDERREEIQRILLSDEIGFVRATAAANPHLLKDTKEGRRLLLEALDSTEAVIRDHAMPGLKHLDDPALLEAQIRKLLKTDPGTAKSMTDLRQQIKNPQLWQTIVETLADSPDPESRIAAIPLVEDEAVRDRLVMELTAMTEGYHANSAAFKLKELPPKIKNDYFERLASDENPQRRKSALVMSWGIESKALKARVLKKLLRDPDEEVLADALSRIPDFLKPSKKLDKIILKALHSDNPKVRKSAAWSIKMLTLPDQRLTEFLKAIRDPEAKVRQWAVRSLDAVEIPKIREGLLREAMKDSDPDVRMQAMFNDTWKDWEPESFKEALQAFASDPSHRVREYLPYSIGKFMTGEMTKFFESPYARLMDESLKRLDPGAAITWPEVMPAWLLLLRSGADGSRMRRILKGHGEVADHARKQCDAFTQEGQKPLTEERMTRWLERTAGYILMAITLLGPEAVKAKFDEKAAKFQQYLLMAHVLGTNPVLGPEAYKTFQGRTSYPAWQSNRTLEILYGLTLLGKPEEAKAILQEIRKSRTIDLDDIQDRFLKSFGEVAGLKPEELAGEDIRERLKRWDDPYIYTLGSALNNLQEEPRQILMEILEADLKNRVPEFLEDPTKPWGEANTKTREAFGKHGLDYGQWLGYDEPMTATIGDRTLEIELWNRDPAEDLFIGSHVKTCLALDTRSEEMVDAFLHTFAQYAMIRDKASGDRIGYIRMFWMLPEGKNAPPQLVVDNVAYAFEKEDPNTPQLIDIADQYARQFSKAVTQGREVSPWFSKFIHFIPNNNSERVPIQVLGSVRNNSYYLFAVDQYIRSSLDKPLTAQVIRPG